MAGSHFAPSLAAMAAARAACIVVPGPTTVEVEPSVEQLERSEPAERFA